MWIGPLSTNRKNSYHNTWFGAISYTEEWIFFHQVFMASTCFKEMAWLRWVYEIHKQYCISRLAPLTGDYALFINDQQFPPILPVSDWPRRHLLEWVHCKRHFVVYLGFSYTKLTSAGHDENAVIISQVISRSLELWMSQSMWRKFLII